MSSYTLNGKVALVTGGARGIGFATAKELVARGAKVIVLDLHEDAVQQAAAQLGGDALGIAGDVTDRDAMDDVVATVVERFEHRARDFESALDHRSQRDELAA